MLRFVLLSCCAVVAAAGCRSEPIVCGGTPAEDCQAVAGLWEGRATPNGTTRFLLSVGAETCRIKGSIELSAEDGVYAALDGAMCTADRAELAFDGLVASGQGELTFDVEAGEVVGSVGLTIREIRTDFGRGDVVLELEGIAREEGGLDEACSLRCDDGNPCTDDVCDESLECANRNNDAPCDDGDPCTASDQCIGGTCRSVTPVTCDDDNPCTDDACQAGTGDCINDPITSSAPGVCDDGDACTGPDACDAGVCVGPDTGVCVCPNGTCDPGEDCNTCSADCEDFVGSQAETFCCGDGIEQVAETDGSICDGNF